MLRDHIAEIMKKYMVFSPTDEQLKLLDVLAEFVMNQGKRELLLIKGYAGTGKTSMIGIFIKALQEMSLKSILLAPTGRAAKVLSAYSGNNASTIHKKIYRQKSSKDAFGEFSLDRNINSNTFFIVDEASMLSDQSFETSVFGSGNLLRDLISYVYNDKNCKLILIGDTAQLPPVGQPVSQAMNKHFLEMFDMSVIEHTLSEVVRQTAESAILTNATAIRQLIGSDDFNKPKLKVGGMTDVRRIAGNEFMEEVSQAYRHYGLDDTIVICRSNKIANRYNQGVRNHVLYREEELSAGDYLMVVKNNYFWLEENNNADFIANGDIVRIKRVKKYEEMYGFRFAQVDVVLPDYGNMELSVKLLLDTLYSEAPALNSEENKRLFYTISEDYVDICSLKNRYAKVKENKYFNALQVKYAYAVTCHKSQGGQWRAVFIDQSYFRDEMLTPEYLKWLYTALTRASERVYLVNFGDDFFEG
ncbi:MAG: AAA family ATPase [Bacteroidota bacterium]|nr:AAA family ATPase [Bacteroidota bacterium]